jgi:hypothetical protein
MSQGSRSLLLGFLLLASGLPAVAETHNILDLPVLDYKVGFADLWIGRNVSDRKVLLHNREIQDYLFAHPPSRIRYAIPPGVSTFTAWGVRTDGDSNVVGTWFYIVKIDGKEAFRSEPLVEYKNYTVPISVRIPPGSRGIELIIDNMGNGFCDHAIWALPTFQ